MEAAGLAAGARHRELFEPETDDNTHRGQFNINLPCHVTPGTDAVVVSPSHCLRPQSAALHVQCFRSSPGNTH